MTSPVRDAPAASVPCRTGIRGLDDILAGGLPANRLYLVRGTPGTGKTTLALQFLLEGRRAGERGLCITLSETGAELRSVAASHGWDLDGLELVELAGSADTTDPAVHTTMLHPSEQELARTTRTIEERVRQSQPHRVVFDSLSELRLLAQNALRYRRQILGIKSFLATCHCTVLLLDDQSDSDHAQVESLAHGVIELQHLRPDFGAERRRLSVIKLRGLKFRGGYHDYVIRTGGLDVFPRLVASEHIEDFAAQPVTSGIPELDRLLGGGLDAGTSTLFIGPAGAGKSTLALHYGIAAAMSGERSCAVFAFEEVLATIHARARGLGLPIDAAVATGRLQLRQVDPAELSPGEFASLVRQRVDEDGVRLIIIDSINGYLNSMPGEPFQVAQVHELLTYLAQRGVVTIMVVAQHGLIGSMQAPVDITYLADGVVLLRFFEFQGSMRKAVSVMKKRSGSHEPTIRELRLEPGAGVRIGPALAEFRGVLTGVPVYTGSAEHILEGLATGED
jgi:circadian clock protein KaiC